MTMIPLANAATTGVVVLLIIISLIYGVTVQGRRNARLPPGPPTLPIIGNLHQLPRDKGYLQFAKWAKEYGQIYSLKIASRTMIVISSRRLVKEIMDKKNSISGFRPPAYAVNNLIYKGDFLLLMNPDDAKFRRERKLIHQFYMDSVCEKRHLPYIIAESAQLMVDILNDSDRWSDHSTRYTNSLIMSTIYGFRTPSTDTVHLHRVLDIAHDLSRVIMPGKLPPVDIFPFLNYLPERLFDNWRSKCRNVAKKSDKLYAEFLDHVIERREKLGSKDTFADKVLEQKGDDAFTRHEVMYLLSTVLDAGTDTTSGAFNTLVQMLTQNQHILKDAQEEMDQVVELVVDNYALPKGSSIIVNISGLHHDEKKFPNALEFDPKNYEGKDGLATAYSNAANYEDRDHYGYGFGRRLCPGIHFAERSLFITFSKLIWGFDIAPAKDDQGRPVPINTDWATGYSGGAILHPDHFQTCIKVRSEKKREILLRDFEEAKKLFSTLDAPPREN
ncbi:hypothetical protein LTS17_006546 [Exophiala oligosperma]